MSSEPSQGTRSRDIVFYPKGTGGDGVEKLASGGTRRYPIRVVGRQTTFSAGRSLFPLSRRIIKKIDDPARRARLARQDYGGNFQSTTNDFWMSHPEVGFARSVIGGTIRYDGWISPVPLNVGPDSAYWPAIPTSLGDAMLMKGSTAIARTIPTNPAAGAGQFLGELHQVPAIPGKALIRALSKGNPGSKTSSARGAAGEYLNWEFGIKPVISDVQKLVKAQHDSDKIVKQLARDSGRLIRRRYSFPEERTVERVSLGNGGTNPPFDIRLTDANADGVPKYRTREVLTRTWFSGAYTYHYDQGETTWKRMMAAEQRASRVYGLRLSPALLWELAPWSWLVDWKSNLGDVMTNISAFSKDGLVLCWGYVMCEMTITDTYSFEGFGGYLLPGESSKYGRSGIRNGVSVSFQTKVKKRLRATPYGFGLDPNWSDFTDRQLSILGALGITRAPR